MRYGWLPDRPDCRDLMMARAPAARTTSLPQRVDLRSYGPVIYDQGALGSCTANAIGAAVQFSQIKQRRKVFRPSRLFIYYNEREMENSVGSDSGAMIRDGIKSVNAQGVCPEPEWPYVVERFAVKPPEAAYQSALEEQTIRYHRVAQDVDQVRAALASRTPVVFGFTAYTSFEGPEVARTGELAMPTRRERPVGGHAVLAVGYDDQLRRFIVRNSWGADWGLAGHFTMPYAYLTDPNLADDLWAISQVK